MAINANGSVVAAGAEDKDVRFWNVPRTSQNPQRNPALSAEELARHWDALGGENGTQAYHSLEVLVAAPGNPLRPNEHKTARAEDCSPARAPTFPRDG